MDRIPGMIGIEKYRKYALTLPLVFKAQQWHLIFEVRAAGLRRQPGEICFPGGRVETGEEKQSAAVRETCEELMVSPESVEIIKPLDVFVSPFDLIVFPYLARLKDYKGTYSTDEVARILEIPVRWFLEYPPEIYKNRIITVPEENFPYDKIPGGRSYPWNRGSYDVVFYSWKEETIWGMTAAILKGSLPMIREFLESNSREPQKSDGGIL